MIEVGGDVKVREGGCKGNGGVIKNFNPELCEPVQHIALDGQSLSARRRAPPVSPEGCNGVSRGVKVRVVVGVEVGVEVGGNVRGVSDKGFGPGRVSTQNVCTAPSSRYRSEKPLSPVGGTSQGVVKGRGRGRGKRKCDLDKDFDPGRVPVDNV